MNLGANGQTYAGRGKGTLIVNGGTLYCNGLMNGSGDSGSWLYGEGHIEMNAGVIDCNYIQMSLPDDGTGAPDSPDPYGQGSIDLAGGTINITNEDAMYGMDGNSLDIHITGGTLIIEDDPGVGVDMDALIAFYISQGWITTEAGRELMHDNNVTNPGKTTVWAKLCTGDLDGDCDADLDDLNL